ncbi:MAG: glucose-1-phosphate adenylyltransferase, partial [candidate division WOR-3 bacterium]
SARVFGFEFKDYWRDVGTIDAYWHCNMDLLNTNSGLDIENWNIRTNLFVRGEIGARTPAFISRAACISNSLISSGCIIEGTVQNSVISPGVVVEENAKVVDSIIFHNVVIKKDASLLKTIVDKNVKIGKGTTIGAGDFRPNKTLGKNLSTGITVIGKNAIIPDRVIIGKNCIISSGLDLCRTKIKKIDSGSTF